MRGLKHDVSLRIVKLLAVCLITLGLQGKRYHLGTYKTFDEAVAVRLYVEEFLHDGFITCYEKWQKMAAADKRWAAQNPFILM